MHYLNGHGLLISIFFHENELGYKVSLRSNSSDVNVSEIAEVFDGGGHIKAAGCLICEDFETAKRLIMKEVKKYL